MKKAVIYGSTGTGKSVYEKVKDKYDVMYFVDENDKRFSEKNYGLDIKDKENILKDSPDVVIMGQLTGYIEAAQWLAEKGFPEERIVCTYVDLTFRARVDCLKSVAAILSSNLGGCLGGAVAELGVYRGVFARVINETFPERKLYLFDTFEGFPQEDINYEIENELLTNDIGMLTNTSVDYVLGKMPHQENVVIRKGYFPDTVEGLEEKFVFVNIDVDLYKPIKAGLEYFWPRMVDNGYIFVHDYFSNAYAGSRKAVEEFAEEHRVGFIPIGDTLSVAFVKKG